MRLQALSLLAYGKFTDRTLRFPRGEHDFHVIVGPNEAGKSTVRRALAELLFGMPHSSPLAFLHAQSDLRLGGVLQAKGEDWAFMRTKQNKSLRTLDGQPLPDDYLAPVLGSLAKEAFEQMHCLDHARLVAGGQSIVDPRNSVSQMLFQAAAGIESFAAIRDSITERANELFGARRTATEYARAAQRYAEAQAALKALQVRTQQWTQARQALEKADADLQAEQGARSALQGERVLWERVIRLTPVLERVERHRAALDSLGEVKAFPHDARARLEAGHADLSSAQALVEARRKDLQARQAEWQAITLDEGVWGRAADIERLADMRSRFGDHRRDLLLRQNEVDQLLQQVLSACAEFGWGASEQEVRERLPREKVLRPITTLLKERGGVLQAERAAMQVERDKKRELEDLGTRLETLPASHVDPELRVAYSRAVGFAATEAQQRALKQAVADAQAAVSNAMLALGRPDLSTQDLRAMRMPSESLLASYRKQRQEAEAGAVLARSRMDDARHEAQRLELALAQFQRSHKVVTAGEVSDARRERDLTWSSIKAGVVAVDAAASRLDGAIRLADELVDGRMRSETDGAELQGLRDQLEQARAAQSQHQAQYEKRKEELAQFDLRWAELTSSLGFDRMALDDLPEWMLRREAALTAADTLVARRRACEQERHEFELAQADLIQAMRKSALEPKENERLAVLCAVAQQHIQESERNATRRAGLEQQLVEAQRALQLATQAAKDRADDSRHWNARWNDALSRAHIPGAGNDADEVEIAVNQAISIAQWLQRIDGLRTDRIQAMQADLDSFERFAGELARAVAPDLTASEPFEVARQLAQRLAAAKQQLQNQQNARRAVETARQQHAAAQDALTEVTARLRPLLELACVERPLDAIPQLERAEQKRDHAQAVAQALEAIEKEGLSLEALRAELALHQASDAPAKLQAIKDRFDESERRLPVLVRTQLEAKQGFEAIGGQDSAAIAESQRQEALAEMSTAGEEYLRLATASRLLKWAVDKYRDRKQVPMLHRASAVFRTLTHGSFDKLRIDYDQEPPALLAYRPSGHSVKVTGLSDGTRDQLFLALRIAALELQMEHAAPLPFIADDLFINFDDDRSRAGLQALFELSAKTQVVFLSHQEHLVPVIEDLFGQKAHVVRLSREEVLA